MTPRCVFAALCFLPLLAGAEAPSFDFRQARHGGMLVVGMECHKKNGTLEVGIYYPGEPLRRMDLWLTDKLVEVDPKSNYVLGTRQVERSCAIGADRYRVRFEGLPGAANVMWQCGALISATVTVWKNGRQVLQTPFDDNPCRGTRGIRTAVFRSGSDTPEITRFPEQP
jgi:hypothetical protein